MEAFVPKKRSGKKLATKFTEEEINSYLALHLKPRYHPCLKSLSIEFEADGMQSVAAIDFDRLGTTSNKFIAKIIGVMFSGMHTMTARGKILSGQGKGRFLLQQARFDGNALPNYLVNEIIAAVGLRQKPPFDPTQPSKLPHEIDRVEMQPGFMIAYQ